VGIRHITPLGSELLCLKKKMVNFTRHPEQVVIVGLLVEVVLSTDELESSSIGRVEFEGSEMK